MKEKLLILEFHFGLSEKTHKAVEQFIFNIQYLK